MRKIGFIAAASAAAAVIGGGAGAAVQRARKLDYHVVPRSMFGPITIRNIAAEDGTEVRVMRVGGAYQSATFLDERRFQPVFEYYRSFDRMFEASIPIRRVLMLGGGGFAYPKHLLTTSEYACIDVVEVDPAVIKAARKWFFLDELVESMGEAAVRRLGIHCADGCDFLAQAQPGTYDAIINDAFDGMNPTVQLLTTKALADAKTCLTKDGLYMLNAVIGPEDDDVLNTFMEILAEAFANVWAIPCTDTEFSGEDNYLVIASDGEHSFPGTCRMLCS